MRNIVLALLLANLLVLAWQAWVVPQKSPRKIFGLPQDHLDLVYIPRPKSTKTEDDSILSATPRERCVRIGPFGQESDVLQVRNGLESQGVAVQQLSEQSDIWVGHWVLVKDLVTRENARKTLSDLIANGMQGAYIVAEGEPNISLGVFRKQASVDIVTGKAQALGFVVDTADRFLPGTNHYLEMQLTGTQSLQLGRILEGLGQILHSEPVVCPDPA